jgi:hypothetical protein
MYAVDAGTPVAGGRASSSTEGMPSGSDPGSGGIDRETSQDAGAELATCNDGLQNDSETGVDCGAPGCRPCRCELGSFAAPERLTGFGLQGDYFGPALSAGGRTLFFSVVRENVERITPRPAALQVARLFRWPRRSR